MPNQDRCEPGDWVEVEAVLIQPAERSPSLPPETADKALKTWVKGFALRGATLGDDVTVQTMTGRSATGQLSAVNPGYFHTFGRPIPELWHVGDDLRARLAKYRATQGGDR